MTQKQRAYLELHFCIFLWGFTAILGKLITISALSLVWWRVVICCAALLILIPWRRLSALPRGLIGRLVGIGAIIAVHWVCFYGAVKLSNASVAVASMATTALFASFVEPLMLRSKFKWYELMLGVAILPGIWLLIGDLDWHYRNGFAVGVLSAFLAAIFTSLNKKTLDHHPVSPLVMSFYEMSGVLLAGSAALLVLQPDLNTFMPAQNDWLWLTILAVGCTLLPFYLSLRAMRHISAFGANLSINLEPVYGIALAIPIFREDRELTYSFYIGVGIILLAVAGHPWLKSRFDKAS